MTSLPLVISLPKLPKRYLLTPNLANQALIINKLHQIHLVNFGIRTVTCAGQIWTASSTYPRLDLPLHAAAEDTRADAAILFG